VRRRVRALPARRGLTRRSLGKYKHARGNMRLPLARKFGKRAYLEPVAGAAFVFIKCLINVVGDEPLLSMNAEAPSAKAAKAYTQSLVPPLAASSVLNWLECRARIVGGTAKLMGAHCLTAAVTGFGCPVKKRPHKHNTVCFLARFSEHGVTGTFRCMDTDDCDGATWHVNENLTAVAFADVTHARMMMPWPEAPATLPAAPAVTPARTKALEDRVKRAKAQEDVNVQKIIDFAAKQWPGSQCARDGESWQFALRPGVRCPKCDASDATVFVVDPDYMTGTLMCAAAACKGARWNRYNL